MSSNMSYRKLALQEGIRNPSVITSWVQRYRAAGPDALKPYRKGQREVLAKQLKEQKLQSAETDITETAAEYIKELEKENEHLRLENAFLKAVRRLRLEDEKEMRERRSSSTASEENSN